MKEKQDSNVKRDIEGMGVPEIKYGDSVCFVQHVASALWLTYKAQDAKSARLGPLKRKVMFGWFLITWKMNVRCITVFYHSTNVAIVSLIVLCSFIENDVNMPL